MRPNHQGLLSDAAAAESSQIAQGLQRRRGIESTLSSLDEKVPAWYPPAASRTDPGVQSGAAF